MEKAINNIRMLSMDMIEKANSGHPGICLGAAPMIYILYQSQMKVYAKKSDWINRDRFILSAGHGSSMLYSTLHLAGFDLEVSDLQKFRQLGSKTPGHPEYKHTDGIDSTSGPLGQGFAQAVGMAISEKHLASLYNQENLNIFDHYTYVICGDGDLQEGISSEASSLAGHLKLNKLIVLWDSNQVQLDSDVNQSNTEDTLARYKSYGWNTIIVDANDDPKAVSQAISEAKKSHKPTMIEVKTIIGYGSPNKAGTSDSHGAPLGIDEIKQVKDFYNWKYPEFTVLNESKDNIQANTIITGEKEYQSWNDRLVEYQEQYPEKFLEVIKIINGDIDYNLEEIKIEDNQFEATRVSSGKVINHINNIIPNLIGGSADLSKSNNSLIKNSNIFQVDGDDQKNIYYGVREFAMASITNGIMLHGGLKAYCSTFFIFSDYLKPALRMSALQKLASIYVLTHDSVAVGEDGPTHQPIEQLTGLRSIPNVNVMRPSDFNETQIAWQLALESESTPYVLVLSRQNLKIVTNINGLKEKMSYGAYVISDCENYQKIIIATGSEVSLAIDVQAKLIEAGIPTRVISMPSFNTFDKQSDEYKSVLFGHVKYQDRYFIEMATCLEGYKFAQNVININTFGESGKPDSVIDHFGFTVDKIVDQINK